MAVWKAKQPGLFVLEGSCAPPDFPPTRPHQKPPFPHLPSPHICFKRGERSEAKAARRANKVVVSTPGTARLDSPAASAPSAYPPPGPGPRAAWRARSPSAVAAADRTVRFSAPSVRVALHLFSPRNRCPFSRFPAHACSVARRNVVARILEPLVS